MKIRRVFSCALSVFMAAALTLPALAVDEDVLPPEPETVDMEQNPEEIQEPEDIQVSEEVQEPEESPEAENVPKPVEMPETPEQDLIEVVVPAVGGVVLNPYRMEVDTASGEVSKEQVIHEPQALHNNSSFPVKVNVEAVGEVWDGRFVPEPPSEDSEVREIFMYAEFRNSADGWAEGYTGAENQVIVSEEGTAAENVLVLEGNSEGYFRLSGTMAAGVYPLWSEENALDVTLSYSFEKMDGAAEPDTGIETPDESEENTTPDTPTETELPDNTETPDDTTTPDDTETPDEPEAPDDTETQDEPEAPDDTETPDEPEVPDDMETPDEPESPSAPDPEPEPEPVEEVPIETERPVEEEIVELEPME